MPQPQLQWYEQGFWPLIGVALVLIIPNAPNAIALITIFLQSRSQNKSQLLMKQIDLISEQLAEF